MRTSMGGGGVDRLLTTTLSSNAFILRTIMGSTKIKTYIECVLHAQRRRSIVSRAVLNSVKRVLELRDYRRLASLQPTNDWKINVPYTKEEAKCRLT
jgi:hypothetical protein